MPDHACVAPAGVGGVGGGGGDGPGGPWGGSGVFDPHVASVSLLHWFATVVEKVHTADLVSLLV